ncbi:vWA domain-containing protein [Persephonella sp.]
MGIEFKYSFASLIGLIVIICVIICSIYIKSRKIALFPHLDLFGEPKRFIVRYIPFLVILLTILVTVLAMHPFVKEHLYSEKRVYNIIIALDVSNSMKEKNKLKISKEIIRDFLLKRDEEDRIGILVFDNLPFRLMPLTTDRGALLRVISVIRPAMVDVGGTAMYDGLVEALNMFMKDRRSKIIILLTDGGDINSKYTLEDVIRFNQDIGAKIYTIGVSSGMNFYVLERLSEATGGKAFFVTKDYQNALKSVFDEINMLEPSYIQEYKFDVEKPVDFYVKLAAVFVVFLILVKILLTPLREKVNV